MTVSVPQFVGCRILVVGDLMLDRYWFGPTTRISPEAPVPVVHIGAPEDRPGGAANVALNLAALEAEPTLIGIVGADEAGEKLRSLLEAADVACFFGQSSGPTITKLRVLSRNQQLIRLDHERSFVHGDDVLPVQDYQAQLKTCPVVVLSDYGKGTLRNPQALIRSARQAGATVLVDPKGTDFSRYAGASLLTPNQSEFEAVVGVCADDSVLEQRGQKLRQDLSLDHLLITRGDKGMTLISADQSARHLNAETREVYDVTGAGDTVLATMAAALAAGAAMLDAAALANLAAGLVVRKIGVATVSRAEIRHELHSRGVGGRSLIAESELVTTVRESQQRGETVVMTNGCFDILHSGHVAYLEEAKKLGDRLVVAVNDDASVSSLKGAGRPVVPLADRMTVLAGLAAVDWVIPFSEATPQRLICAVLPDILVKGGDYQADEIAGAGCVKDNGGRVEVVKFHPGNSTSAIIERIRNTKS